MQQRGRNICLLRGYCSWWSSTYLSNQSTCKACCSLLVEKVWRCVPIHVQNKAQSICKRKQEISLQTSVRTQKAPRKGKVKTESFFLNKGMHGYPSFHLAILVFQKNSWIKQNYWEAQGWTGRKEALFQQKYRPYLSDLLFSLPQGPFAQRLLGNLRAKCSKEKCIHIWMTGWWCSGPWQQGIAAS